MNKLNIKLGALAPKLIEQIKVKEKFQEKIVQFLQEDADAVTRLQVRGLLTDKESSLVRKRLFIEIQNEFGEKS